MSVKTRALAPDRDTTRRLQSTRRANSALVLIIREALDRLKEEAHEQTLTTETTETNTER